MKITTRTTCRICGSRRLKELFSLGELYISTFIKDKNKKNLKAPLDIIYCETCTLVQLRHTAPQELMYSGQYWYKSGVNEKIINDLHDVVDKALEIVPAKVGDI